MYNISYTLQKRHIKGARCALTLMISFFESISAHVKFDRYPFRMRNDPKYKLPEHSSRSTNTAQTGSADRSQSCFSRSPKYWLSSFPPPRINFSWIG
jgi:hypothetical protein